MMDRPVCSEDVYEKWLRRRLDYATIRATGSHPPPPFFHLVTHYGTSKYDVHRELRYRILEDVPKNRDAGRDPTFYTFPREVEENLDFRFFSHPDDKYCMSREGALVEKCPSVLEPYDVAPNPVTMATRQLSLPQLVDIPKWRNSADMQYCPYPHQLETPLSWALRKKQVNPINPCPKFTFDFKCLGQKPHHVACLPNCIF